MKQDFDFSGQTAGIKARTLIVAADADIFPPSHAVEMFALLRWRQAGCCHASVTSSPSLGWMGPKG